MLKKAKNRATKNRGVFSPVIFIAVIFIHSLTINASSLLAPQKYQWNKLELTLPFQESWLVKKPRTKEEDPLVFFFPRKAPPPRIVATVFETQYDLKPEDFSAFKKDFLKSKMAWLKKEESELKGEIIAKPLKSGEQTFRYYFIFNGPHGEYKEYGIFDRCGNKGLTAKVMVPKRFWNKPVGEAIHSFFTEKGPCSKK